MSYDCPRRRRLPSASQVAGEVSSGMLCSCACSCCATTLRVGKLLAYPDGTIEPVGLSQSLSNREYQLLAAILEAFPRPVHAGKLLYGTTSPGDTHSGRVMAVHLRAKLKPWGIELPNLPGRGYTISG